MVGGFDSGTIDNGERSEAFKSLHAPTLVRGAENSMGKVIRVDWEEMLAAVKDLMVEKCTKKSGDWTHLSAVTSVYSSRFRNAPNPKELHNKFVLNSSWI